LSLEHLALTKAHRQVEGDHRRSAWHVILSFVAEAKRPSVVESMGRALRAWQAYRDDVAAACGVGR
jgi:pyrroloquinoline-quinone synthase